jgi:hypothetical protein
LSISGAVDAIETVHRVEMEVHRAGEEYGKFAQDLGIVLQVCFGEAVEIIEIAWMAPIDHGFDLPAKQQSGCIANLRLRMLPLSSKPGKHTAI